MKNSKTKIAIILSILLVVVIAIIAGVFIFKRKDKSQSDTQEKPKIIEPVNQIPIKDRPFSNIYPRSDGKEVTLIVNEYPGATSVEYELEYQAGTLLQGAFGKIDFTKETAPVERNILLGSCSAGGKCSYHENVNGGSLTLRYINGESTKLKSEWNFQLMSKQEGSFTSRDAKFTFNVGPRGFPSSTYVVIAQTMGLPGEIEGEILAGPYNVSLPKGVSLKGKEATLTIRLSSEEENVKIMGWTQDGWLEYDVDIDGKIASTTVDQATTFVAISSQEIIDSK